jgi:hypothetical protein
MMCPLLDRCPVCGEPELIGAGETEFVCHGDVVTINLGYSPADVAALGPVLESA